MPTREPRGHRFCFCLTRLQFRLRSARIHNRLDQPNLVRWLACQSEWKFSRNIRCNKQSRASTLEWVRSTINGLRNLVLIATHYYYYWASFRLSALHDTSWSASQSLLLPTEQRSHPWIIRFQWFSVPSRVWDGQRCLPIPPSGRPVLGRLYQFQDNFRLRQQLADHRKKFENH